MACRVTKSKMNCLWRLGVSIRSPGAACGCQCRSRSVSLKPIIASAVRSPSCHSRRDHGAAAIDVKPILQHAAAQEASSSNLNSSQSRYPLDVLKQLDMDPDALHALASQTPTPLSLADMFKYASSVSQDQRLYNAQFLHKELAIRLAQRAVDLMTLPLGLADAESIRQVARLYLQYIKQLQEMAPPKTPAQEDAFTQLLQSFVLDRSTIPTQIARGVGEWTAAATHGHGNNHLDLQERQDILEEALYRFFTARVGLRFLIEHHVVSSTRSGNEYRKSLSRVFSQSVSAPFTTSNMAVNASTQQDARVAVISGCIQSNVDVVEETRKVAGLVRAQTLQAFGCCPDIHIVDCIQPKQQQQQSRHVTKPKAHNTGFTYVPHHLHYMLAELLMNSCRATVRTHGRGTLQNCLVQTDNGVSSSGGHERLGDPVAPMLPPIRVVLVMGKEDITIKVCDKGGGVPRSLMGKIWKFGHSTDAVEDVVVTLSSASGGTEEVAGAHIRGFGLPLARIYARYFGGELNLKSLEGHGVDAYLHLPRLGDSGEHLPLRVRSSPGELDSIPRVYK
ncbi:hypothetical protein MPSEU_000524200 [Mayamaea pseudoterrestris]|nr:hypothetical protein MPSEU_000524200 [Mayamaea pseudoterrestris]